ncbi:MAG TPA: site-specific DNA-methyltransferase [Patescibacteria group bacterium]|nr:site-specific DNA-methyltransferase [Patescibacteria group bacterium]
MSAEEPIGNPAAVIGDCTLYLGDCLEILPTLAAGSVDAVITDPPYGIDYQSARRIDSQRFAKLYGDKGIELNWLNELPRIVKNSACLEIFCRWDVAEHFRLAIQGNWSIKSQVIWDRGIHGLGDLNGQYAPCHDNLWFATRGEWSFPGKRPRSIYRIDRLSASELLHPTQKPLPLIKRIIMDITNPDDFVLDPFMGSGTTGVACVQTGRRFIGIEIDPGYFAIAEKRIREAQMQLRMPI